LLENRNRRHVSGSLYTANSTYADTWGWVEQAGPQASFDISNGLRGQRVSTPAQAVLSEDLT
jgi:hypothetical protein